MKSFWRGPVDLHMMALTMESTKHKPKEKILDVSYPLLKVEVT